MSIARRPSPPPPRFHRTWQVAVIALFLAVIAAPGLAMLAGGDRQDPEETEENRELAPFPELGLDLASLRAFPDGFSRYFEDHFAFRARLVRWQAEARLRGLHVSPSSDVLVGTGGWFFYAADGAVEDYIVEKPFSQEELETWRRALQDTQDWLERRGITYLFVIAPDKHVIYPERMPEGIRPLHDESRIDELVEHLAAHSSVHVLDLRPALLEAKAQGRLFHRTDTHWNGRGAYVGYQQIMERLDAMRPGLAPFPPAAFLPVSSIVGGLDLARMMGLAHAMTEEDLRLQPLQARCARSVDPPAERLNPSQARLATECSKPGLPRAVVFRDSFASALVPYLSEHFSRALYLWQRDMDPAVIDAERPDVVIQEWVGRRLSTALPYDPVPDQGAEAGAASQQ